jgi:hypothetical protein
VKDGVTTLDEVLSVAMEADKGSKDPPEGSQGAGPVGRDSPPSS